MTTFEPWSAKKLAEELLALPTEQQEYEVWIESDPSSFVLNIYVDDEYRKVWVQ